MNLKTARKCERIRSRGGKGGQCPPPSLFLGHPITPLARSFTRSLSRSPLPENEEETGQYKTRTADYGLRTTDYGLGIKHGLRYKNAD